MQKKSSRTFLITRAENPWQGMTASYEQEEKNKQIASIDLDEKYFESFIHLKEYDKPDPLLVRLKDAPNVVINSRYFSALIKADVTKAIPGQPQPIGYFVDTEFKRLSARQLVIFLIESQIITTYWHVEAELTLTGEDDSPDFYQTRFEGQHIYFTNERNESKLDFTVRINKQDGRMEVL